MNHRLGCRLLPLVCSLLLAAPAAAQETAASLRDLIARALEKNIGLQVERLSVPLAAEQVVQEDAVFDSEFFAAAGYAKTVVPLANSALERSSGSDYSAAAGLRKRFETGASASLSLDSQRSRDNQPGELLQPRYRTALVLDLTQPLLRDAGSQVNGLPRELARNRSQQAQHGYLLQAQALALTIEDLVVQLAAAEETVLLRQQAVQLATETLAANRRRLEVGVIPLTEVQEAETALADRELRLSLAVQNRDFLRDELNRQLGEDLVADDSAATLVGPLPQKQLQKADLPRLFAAAKDKRLDLQIADIDLASSGLQTVFFRHQLKPRLDLNLQAGLNGLSGSGTGATGYAGPWGDSTTSLAEADGYQWGAGLQFSIPLGNRAAKSRLQQAELQQRQARYRRSDLELLLKTELQQQLAAFDRAAEQLEIAGRFESLAEKTLRQEQRRLDEGLSDTFRIIAFQDKMIDARIGRNEAAAQYRRTNARLNFVRGLSLEQNGIEVRPMTQEDARE